MRQMHTIPLTDHVNADRAKNTKTAANRKMVMSPYVDRPRENRIRMGDSASNAGRTSRQ